MGTNKVRKALVRRSDIKTSTVKRYLPSNYDIYREVNANTIEIHGVDKMGWTLDDYVIPRLGSGGYAVEEID